MKDKNKKQHQKNAGNDEDVLSQTDLITGSSSFALTGQLHAALETPEGKNNGAEPVVFQNQRKAHT